MFLNSKSSNFAESTTRNCETCGTNMIPYPLSTGPKCGDLTYFNFHCNITTGQVSFEAPGGTYRVTNIYPEKRKFVIKITDANDCKDRNLQDKILQLNQSSPFKVISWCNFGPANFSSDLSFKGEDEVEIGWDQPKEPSCSSHTDCKDWPNSTCNATGDGKTRCLCNAMFVWDSLSLNCTQGEDTVLAKICNNVHYIIFVLE